MTNSRNGNVKWVALAWAPYSRMSQTFAREIGGKLHCVHYLRFQSPPHAPFKYILQAVKTLRLLFRERPDAVHVQTPPFVAGLVVDFYCRLTGAEYVLHYHSAAFSPIWDWALPFTKYLARRAKANIVTNQHWADIVASWGGHPLVMVDPFLDLPESEPYQMDSGFNIAVVSTFADDEPLGTVLEAAEISPEVNFYITGDKRKKSPGFFERAPANVKFTGFLDPDHQYPGLLRTADAVMVLTTRNYTLQLGGCEAVAVGKPLITSDWPYLHEVFGKGTVYVEASPESIREGIQRLRENYARFSAEVDVLRQESQEEWEAGLRELTHLVGGEGG
jgi:glycosyltransferase involved in cell wall biosynthesis